MNSLWEILVGWWVYKEIHKPPKYSTTINLEEMTEEQRAKLKKSSDRAITAGYICAAVFAFGFLLILGSSCDG